MLDEIIKQGVGVFGLGSILVSLLLLAIAQANLGSAETLRNRYKEKMRAIIAAFGETGANGFLRAVQAANPGRGFHNMARRLIKLGEELGEASEAYLVATTTAKSRKKKTTADLREELIDLGIVALDCALTRMPGEENATDEEIEAAIMEVLATKLAKWESQRAAGQTSCAVPDDAV